MEKDRVVGCGLIVHDKKRDTYLRERWFGSSRSMTLTKVFWDAKVYQYFDAESYMEAVGEARLDLSNYAAGRKRYDSGDMELLEICRTVQISESGMPISEKEEWDLKGDRR